MAQTVAVVRNSLPTAAVGNTVDFTKTSFGTPTAAIIVVCNANTTNNPQDGHSMSVGFWDGTNQRCVAITGADNVATVVNRRASDDSYGAMSINTGSNVIHAYAVSAVTDGIRLTLSVDNSNANRYCTVLLLAGVSSEVFTLTMNPTQNSTVTKASMAFTPKLVFFTTIGATATDTSPSTGPSCVISFGFADVNGVHRLIEHGLADNVGFETANILYSETRCVAQAAADAIQWSGEVTTWNSDGFVLTTRDGGSSSDVVHCLALGGADLSYDVGTLTTLTSASTDTVATDIAPDAVMLALSTAAGTTLESDADANGFMLGMADDNGQFAHNSYVEDGADTSNCGSVAQAAAVLDLDSSSGGSRTDLCDATVALNSADFTLTYSAADATARKGWWVAFGAGAAAVSSTFSGRIGATSAGAGAKTVSLGINALYGSLGAVAGSKAAQAGISAVAGLLGALESTQPGSSDFNAIVGALVNITHATARVSTIQAKAGSRADIAGIHQAISSLQAIAGATATLVQDTDNTVGTFDGKGGARGAFAVATARSSSIQAIAGAAAALNASTARTAAYVARAGLLGTDSAATIRAGQLAALSGLKAAIAGINSIDADKLLYCEVGDVALYQCAVMDQALYNCTLSEAILH